MDSTNDITLCACGCGTVMPIWLRPKNHPNRQPPRFLSGHNCRVMKTKRPDPTPPNPSGFCMCGCDREVHRSAKTVRGNVKGEFVRYLQGHAPEIGRRNADDTTGPNPAGKCLCGCGSDVSIADRTDPIKQTLSGCYVRFVKGHDKWRNRPAGVERRTGVCACGCGESTPIAARSARGNIKGQPMLYVDSGHQQRDQPEIDPQTGCWLKRPDPTDGYNRVHRNGIAVLAHIWYWELQNGPVPEGFDLDHLCRVRNCCNPNHLEAVPHAENCRRIALDCRIPRWPNCSYTVDPNTGCWNFDVIQMAGYGQIWIGTEILPAHLVYYQQAMGQVPKGLELDHTCRNKACVNPDHLEPVTRSENIRRAVAAKRLAATLAQEAA